MSFFIGSTPTISGSLYNISKFQPPVTSSLGCRPCCRHSCIVHILKKYAVRVQIPNMPQRALRARWGFLGLRLSRRGATMSSYPLPHPPQLKIICIHACFFFKFHFYLFNYILFIILISF